MKVEVISTTDIDGYERERMIINGKESVNVGPLCECPEDAIIGRDLISCIEILDLMRIAFEAGKSGESLDGTIKEVPIDNFYD
jgi:hypothetical protein